MQASIEERERYLHRSWQKWIRTKYGLTEKQYRVLLKAQRGLCAICKEPETHTRHGKVKKLSIDHEHKTGRIRGLLCNRCNTAIGRFRDRPDLLKEAIAYLSKI